MKSISEKYPIRSNPEYKINKNGDVYGKSDKTLKHDITYDGYHRVVLYKDNKPKHYPVHRLVAETFIPNPENKPTVNHIDGNKDNNSVDNLEWSTHSENSQHAYDTKLNRCHFTSEDRRKAGETRAAQTSKPVRLIETGEIYSSTRECARINNLNHANISACCNGARKSHNGLHFEWV